jgi:hypothetical protein
LEAWISEGDFLLRELGGRFDVVAGNPPYVRVEQIPSGLLARYRAKYRTLYDRADLYVAFFERALGLLAEGGRLAYVCSDRWTLNKYGGPLRGLVASSYHVAACLDLGEARPFESEVIAYPALFVLRRGPSAGPTWVGKLKRGDEAERRAVLAALTLGADGPQVVALGGAAGVEVARRAGWFEGEEPWVLGGDARVGVLRGLEASFAPLEQTAKVGIGVATGCDRLYLVGPEVDLEPSRRVPLVMREDLRGGKVGAPRLDVINTFEDDGSPVDLGRYPRLAAYLRAHEEELRARYVAKKNPRAWFRTIDRVYPALTHTPKLLIPDIAGANEVALDEGGRYPHHNLYVITSSRWDMEVLGGLLASKVALFFVWSYAPKMRGGYLRFQAQYLKRIRLPDPDTLSARLTDALRAAFRARDYPTLDALALEAYALAELPPFDFTDTRR